MEYLEIREAGFDCGVAVNDYEDEDGIVCECGPKPRKGWQGKLPVALDGNSWPLDFAAKILECSEKDLRDLIRITGLQPVGTMKMASYRRSGRNPRAYDASVLVRLWQGINDLTDSLGNE